jgi:poly-beta-1,6-N-acetyl-D-glucosamine synthase
LADYYKLCQTEPVLIQSSLQHKPIVKIWNGICNNVKIYLIQKENGGKGDALNAGIGFCRGDFFACIDADCTFSTDALSCLAKVLSENEHIVAVGGRVLPKNGLPDFLHQKGFRLREALQGYQELEYGIAFGIIRPVFDKLGTTMLISGALGLFERDVVIRLGGYALDTVGEDMELVMRIRRFAAESGETLKIAYAKEAVCYTEFPWNEKDLRKQRMRWTVGLTEALWKYREMAVCPRYSFLEKLTFCYYVLCGKFAPHIEFTSLIMSIVLGVVYGFSRVAITIMAIIFFLQLFISIVGSLQSIKNYFGSSGNVLRVFLKLLLLVITFVSVYHLWHSFWRLIAIPSFRRKQRKTNKQGTSWVSPTRM